MARNVAILLFDEMEVLDFAGPFEIFAVTGDPVVHCVAAHHAHIRHLRPHFALQHRIGGGLGVTPSVALAYAVVAATISLYHQDKNG